ncbi:MAG: S8 family serine peptidase [Myxococcales bacterium]|nr:S8 family serine peptidase [Myxococcales bacterium]
MRLRLILFLLLTMGLGNACLPTEQHLYSPIPSNKQDPFAGWHAALRSALTGGLLGHSIPKDAQGRYRLLLERKAGSPFPRIHGLFQYAEIGRVSSVRVFPSALPSLQGHPAIQRLSPARRYRPKRTLGASGLLTYASEIGSSGAPISYRFQSPSAGKITILVVGSGSDDTELWTPLIEICADTACNNVLDRDYPSFGYSTSGDPHPTPKSHARVTHTFTQAGTVTLRVSTQDNYIGKFAIFITSEDINLRSARLTGGDITSSKAPRHAGLAAARLKKEQGLDGTGVIIGIIDTGIDWCHTDFTKQDKSRILYLWDQELTPRSNERSPDPQIVGQARFGVEYNRQEIDAALPQCNRNLVRSEDIDGHGTHVAGIAAASGSQPGIAPNAELIVVKGFDDIVSAVKYIVEKAKALRRPLALNMSLGSHIGSHDGTYLDDKITEQVIGPGINLFAAAGNEGNNAIHATTQLSLNQTTTLSYKTTPPYGSSDYPTTIDIFADKTDTFTIEVTAKGQAIPLVWGKTQQGSTSVFTYEWGAGLTHSENPALSHSFFTFKWKSAPQQEETFTFKIKRTQGTGSGIFHAYDTSEEGEFLSLVPKDAEDGILGTISSPGSSKGAICVGAYDLHAAFDLRDGNFFIDSFLVPGDISWFSSRGPTRDGRPGLTIIAPGSYVASTMTTYIQTCLQDPNELYCDDLLAAYTRENTHVLAGTSMATPFATGAAALLLQKDPTLYVRPLFQKAAAPATWTSMDPKIWGAGLLRLPEAYQAWEQAPAPQIRLETTTGQTVGQAPFRPTLRVVSLNGTILKEFFWDTDEKAGNEEITTSPTMSIALETPSTRTIRVVAVAENGRTATASISLRATLDVPEFIEETTLPEPTRESTPDANQEAIQAPDAEPILPEIAQEITQDALTPEISSEQQSDATTQDGPPKSGCGCQDNQDKPSMGWLFFVLLWLMLKRSNKNKAHFWITNS